MAARDGRPRAIQLRTPGGKDRIVGKCVLVGNRFVFYGDRRRRHLHVNRDAWSLQLAVLDYLRDQGIEAVVLYVADDEAGAASAGLPAGAVYEAPVSAFFDRTQATVDAESVTEGVQVYLPRAYWTRRPSPFPPTRQYVTITVKIGAVQGRLDTDAATEGRTEFFFVGAGVAVQVSCIPFSAAAEAAAKALEEAGLTPATRDEWANQAVYLDATMGRHAVG